jgi:hypothetical protein
VIALKMVMLRVFLHCFSKMALAQRNDLVLSQALAIWNDEMRISARFRRQSHREPWVLRTAPRSFPKRSPTAPSCRSMRRLVT